jgi:hypothetical protein
VFGQDRARPANQRPALVAEITAQFAPHVSRPAPGFFDVNR